MQDLFATIRNRHSVRKFQSDMPVEKEKLHAVLEAACAAPSAGDLQAYKIIVVESEDKRNELCGVANNQTFICEAPICLVFCTDASRSESEFGERGKDLYAVQDTTIAAAYAQLAVVAAGLGSTWIGYFDAEKVSDTLNLDKTLEPVAILSVGYAAEFPDPTPRRHLDSMVEYC